MVQLNASKMRNLAESPDLLGRVRVLDERVVILFHLLLQQPQVTFARLHFEAADLLRRELGGANAGVPDRFLFVASRVCVIGVIF